MSENSQDVRIWKAQSYARKTGKGYRVPWRVGTKKFSKSFRVSALAESFRASLITAARKGESFSMKSGLPQSLDNVPDEAPMTWLEHAREFVDAKWDDAAPKHRKSTAYGLMTLTTAVTQSRVAYPNGELLRRALREWSFNAAARRRSPGPPEEFAEPLAWIAAESVPLQDLMQPEVLRRALTAIGRKLDGTPAASSTTMVRRAALSSALVHAVENGRLPSNPLKQIKIKREPQSVTLDVRSVANPEQATALLEAVKAIEPSLHAFFACLYYAALRPAEARQLREQDCTLAGSAWGQIILTETYQDPGASWTDSGKAGEVRGLKHRNVKDIRQVPADPLLVDALREHVEGFDSGAGGLLFPTRVGKFGRPVSPPYANPVSMKTVYRVWAQARERALTKQQAASPLAARPYDLRHACVSTWLEAGVPSTRVAAWAGHSVAVLHRVYAAVLDAREDEAMSRIDTFRKGRQSDG